MSDVPPRATPSATGVEVGPGTGRVTAATEERKLRRHLGFWRLTASGFSNIVGSGWLFAAMYSAQIAGPASLLSWVAAGLLCALVALVMIELGVTGPPASEPAPETPPYDRPPTAT